MKFYLARNPGQYADYILFDAEEKPHPVTLDHGGPWRWSGQTDATIYHETWEQLSEIRLEPGAGPILVDFTLGAKVVEDSA